MNGARSVYLLTTGAAAYFERLGFVPVKREDVPAQIRSATQFASICPVSATVMVKALQP